MVHPLSTCLWFNNNALEGAEFYEQVFPEFKWISKNPMAVNYTILGHKFMNLNGGPGFPINPSISFFIQLTDEKLLEEIWHKLMEGGMIMMDYNTYPWSKKYGWGSDKFGVSWQLMLVEGENSLVPSFMFVQENVGKAEEVTDPAGQHVRRHRAVGVFRGTVDQHDGRQQSQQRDKCAPSRRQADKNHQQHNRRRQSHGESRRQPVPQACGAQDEP